MGGLGGLSGLPFNGLPLPGLLGPAGMQGLGGLQGSLGQDPSDLLRRFGFGLGNNGLGNGLGQLGLPHASPFTAVNPSLGRYMGDQQPFGDLFGLSNSPHRSIRRHLSTDQSDESNNDDKELAELLQAFNTLNGLPKDRSGARSGRVTHQQAPFLGVPSFRGLPHNGFLHRTGLESQSQAEKRPTSAGSNIFQYYQTPDTMARHKLQEVETDTDGYLTFPQSTLI
ncbi:hypothetical protein SK128_025687 [Halocaridina rubra]|uniref:Uncharacterized protein n=1 Tax=Halocaridina rubra TaxID=373956 RepID=A0AAN8WYQ2_HALRR